MRTRSWGASSIRCATSGSWLWLRPGSSTTLLPSLQKFLAQVADRPAAGAGTFLDHLARHGRADAGDASRDRLAVALVAPLEPAAFQQLGFELGHHLVASGGAQRRVDRAPLVVGALLEVGPQSQLQRESRHLRVAPLGERQQRGLERSAVVALHQLE